MKTNRTAVVGLSLLVLVNLAVLFLSVAQVMETGVPSMHFNWGLIPISLTDSLLNGSLLDIGYDLLTLFTCTFLHGNFYHFASNMMMLMLFGILVERQLGTVRFLAIYVASGVLASFGHYCTDIMSMHTLIGASGAVSGIMAAFLVCVFGTGQRPNFLRLLGTASIIQWMYGEVASLMVPATIINGNAVAHDAHLSGFVAGLVITIIVVVLMRRKAVHEAPEKKEGPVIDGDRLIGFDQTTERDSASPGARRLDDDAHARVREQHLDEDASRVALEQRDPQPDETHRTTPSIDGNAVDSCGKPQPASPAWDVSTGSSTSPNGNANAIASSVEPQSVSDSLDERSMLPNGSATTERQSKQVVSVLDVVGETNAEAPVREVPPSVTRVVQTGYQPDKNDSLLD